MPYLAPIDWHIVVHYTYFTQKWDKISKKLFKLYKNILQAKHTNIINFFLWEFVREMLDEPTTVLLLDSYLFKVENSREGGLKKVLKNCPLRSHIF